MTETTKHTRYSPNVGDLARIAGEDPQALYTVEGFQSKGKRTTLAILRSDILDLRREVAVSNLLPPIKRMPRTQPTPKDLAEEASAAAWAEPNKRSHEKAAAAWLRVAGGVRNGKPVPKFLLAVAGLFGWKIDAPMPKDFTDALGFAITHPSAAE